ncbi:Eco57I restriction-modification methylase domain-containing protein [Olleya namhaensis]|uniref:Eco57I restriction-modification methylase domain-containing protein n=1 Tax=Olleya namhaensis TaxID=1144750 RepID=UPI00248F7C7C|nr:N-6 DNA methylase [Olleya namhaensis]
MNQNILKYLKSYSYKVWDINRLLITSFLEINNIKSVKNKFIKGYIITKENNEELEQLNQFLFLLEGINFGIEELLELFEFVISPADKEVNGAVFTPKYIREFIVSESISKYKKQDGNLTNAKFGDIACGCGGFFITIVDKLKSGTKKSYSKIFKENIYGVDIQNYSIERTKILLSLHAIINKEDKLNFEFNLYQGNSLGFDWNTDKAIKKNNGFDIIVGNPPYVGSSKIDDDTKLLLKNWSVSASGKSDLYIPFFEIGMENLNSKGVLGYITVNTFYKSINGRSVRNYFSKNNFDLTIIDFGGEQLFKNRSTYTCICIIAKEPSLRINYIKRLSNNLNSIKKKDYINILYSKLDDFAGWYLISEHTRKIISKIEKTGIVLGDKFDIKNGFATLRNKIYVFKPTDECENYYYFLKDNQEFKIEKNICRDAIKPNTLKSESQIKERTEKLLFPYKISTGNNDLFNESDKSLKIIDEIYFKSQFPFAYKYLISQKNNLSKRDKGNKKYEKWYAFGRNQALTISSFKLLLPYITNKPCFVYTEDKDLLFYNGFAILSNSSEELLLLQKILMSKIFWYYIENTSKPYAGNYFSVAKNYIKNFGICDLTSQEKVKLLNMEDKDSIDSFLIKKYDIILD